MARPRRSDFLAWHRKSGLTAGYCATGGSPPEAGQRDEQGSQRGEATSLRQRPALLYGPLQQACCCCCQAAAAPAAPQLLLWAAAACLQRGQAGPWCDPRLGWRAAPWVAETSACPSAQGTAKQGRAKISGKEQAGFRLRERHSWHCFRAFVLLFNPSRPPTAAGTNGCRHSRHSGHSGCSHLTMARHLARISSTLRPLSSRGYVARTCSTMQRGLARHDIPRLGP